MVKDLISDLHDWEITGLEINREAKMVGINLWFPDTDEKAKLLLKGVSRLMVAGATLQNVILDLMVFEKNSESEYLKYCYQALNIDSTVFSSSILDGSNKILFIEPSVGMELACCFKSLIFKNPVRD